MKRLTTDAPKNNLESALNLFYAKDGEAWVRDMPNSNISLFDFIRECIKKLCEGREDFAYIPNEELAEILFDWSGDGFDSVEGIIGMLYTAGWVAAELRARLKMYEDREEQQKDLENKVSEMLCGYQLEDLARVATLIKKCDVKPEEIKRLSDNIVVLYGAIMKGIKKEVKVAADNVIIECRYPGYADVLRSIEDEKEGRK